MNTISLFLEKRCSKFNIGQYFTKVKFIAVANRKQKRETPDMTMTYDDRIYPIFRMFAHSVLRATSIYSDPVTRDTPNHDAAIPTVNICPLKSLFCNHNSRTRISFVDDTLTTEQKNRNGTPLIHKKTKSF